MQLPFQFSLRARKRFAPLLPASPKLDLLECVSLLDTVQCTSTCSASLAAAEGAAEADSSVGGAAWSLWRSSALAAARSSSCCPSPTSRSLRLVRCSSGLAAGLGYAPCGLFPRHLRPLTPRLSRFTPQLPRRCQLTRQYRPWHLPSVGAAGDSWPSSTLKGVRDRRPCHL